MPGVPRSPDVCEMRRHVIRGMLAMLLVTGSVTAASAGPAEDVAAATQAWVEAFNSRQPQRVQALYAPDAVFWGTSSPTLRTTAALIAEYFAGLPSRPNE